MFHCVVLCILPAGSPFLYGESLDPGKHFLHLWTQLWETGCTVPSTVCWRWFEFYSARFFCFLHGNVSANLSVGFLAAIFLRKSRSFVTCKTWKGKFQWTAGSSASKILFAGVFQPPGRAQKMPRSLLVMDTAQIQAGQYSQLALNNPPDKNIPEMRLWVIFNDTYICELNGWQEEKTSVSLLKYTHWKIFSQSALPKTTYENNY